MEHERDILPAADARASAGDAVVYCGPCPSDSRGVVVENADDVGAGEHHAELERELGCVGVAGNFAVVDCRSGLGFEEIAPLVLDASNLVVDTSGPSAQLGGGRHKEAAAREDAPFHVGEEPVAQGEQSLPPRRRRRERGGDDLGDEAFACGLDGGELQRRFRPEQSVNTALGDSGRLRESPDGESVETLEGREPRGFLHDAGPGALPRRPGSPLGRAALPVGGVADSAGHVRTLDERPSYLYDRPYKCELMEDAMNWQEAGRAWGARSVDWAYLFEQYARPANEVVFDHLNVGPGLRLLDIACGSGLALQLAGRRGAAVAGLDASEALVAIARARTPTADLRVGDMFALPFPDASFDAATSFNGIWKGCDEALSEARRVLVPGGRIGLTFWGRYENLGLMPYFVKVIEHSPPSHGESNMEHGDTGREGVIEAMLTGAGFTLTERGAVEVVNEWPDIDTAVRALAAAGPSIPAIATIGYDAFSDALREVIAPFDSDGVGIRISSELGWITGRTASA